MQTESTSLVTLKAIVPTVLKPRPVQRDQLADDDVLAIEAGHTFDGVTILDRLKDHTFVYLPLSSAPRYWWLYDGHWAGLSAPKAAPLHVPYFSQRDNYRDAQRTCFSSSCAMLLAALRPGAIAGDDDYIREVFTHGDSTDSAAQLKALEHFGLQATFHQDGSLATIKAQLDAGKPVPIGILHHGTPDAPCGGGHWICAIGYTDDPAAPGGGYLTVHDPWGELDHASGVYSATSGAGLHYSYRMIDQRWTVAGSSDGWYVRA